MHRSTLVSFALLALAGTSAAWGQGAAAPAASRPAMAASMAQDCHAMMMGKQRSDAKGDGKGRMEMPKDMRCAAASASASAPASGAKHDHGQ